jgi:transposase
MLTDILYVLKSGIRWEMLPQEMGCGCGMTRWNRLRQWQQAGMGVKLHRLLPEKLEDAGEIGWAWAIVDSSSVRTVGAGKKSGPNPTDRRRAGSKHPVI